MAYNAAKYRAISMTSVKNLEIKDSSLNSYLNNLIITTSQMYGQVKSASLHAKEQSNLPCNESTMAAGLPHFSTGYMRCWGRDVFIALPGLLLENKHFDASKKLIIGFGSTLKHGMIPNLLDSGKYPRYNARDATWWWIWAIIQYTRTAPEGNSILLETTGRRFPPFKRYRSGTPDYLVSNDDLDKSCKDGDVFVNFDDEKCYKYKSTIGELVHEILERHARGVEFREHNAGPQLDHAMVSEGFDISVKTLWDQGGFVSGGVLFKKKCHKL